MRKLVIIALFFVAGVAPAVEPNPGLKLYQFLVWGWQQAWTLQPAHDAMTAADAQIAQAYADMLASSNTINQITAQVESNQIWTISFGWPLEDRLPQHDRQNVMGQEVWRNTLWQDGEMIHAHYITFNAQVSTNPTVLSIEYSGLADDGVTVNRWNASVSSNSYPNTLPITVGTNAYNCYVFYNKVPIALTNCVIDWDNDVIFGAPEGSGRGFSIEGVFVIDDGNNIWVGVNETNIVNGVTNVWINGLEVEQ